MEYRPCPICKGVRAEECECCRGVGRFPYPWILPEDGPVQRGWTAEEDDIVLTAPTPQEAYARYVHVYGDTERSYHSVFSHWHYRVGHGSRMPHWTERELEIMDESSCAREAADCYRMEFGTRRSEKAVMNKYYRMNP